MSTGEEKMTIAATLEKNFDFFLNQNFAEIKEGEWVAIYNKAIIAHGKDLMAVIQEAERIAPRLQVLFSKIKKTAKYLCL